MSTDFLEPGRLWLLAAVGALAVLYVVAQISRRGYRMRFTNVALLDVVAPRRPGWRRHIPAAVLALALVALVLAVARPVDDVRVPRERATVILAVDVSQSMDATDVAPTRLDAAAAAARRFVEDLPPSINLGFITFSGVASLQVTPTTDRAPVLAAIDTMDLAPSTAIGEAIFASLSAIQAVPVDDGEVVPARIVLMSDGKTTTGRPNEMAAQAAAEADVPVSTIAFGTPFGEIYLPEDPLPVTVPVEPGPLREIAETTGGSFFEAESLGELEAVYDDIGSAIGYETVQQEVMIRYVAIALALAFAAAALSLLWFGRLP
jgi:Ca-activated chloride channel family protein